MIRPAQYASAEEWRAYHDSQRREAQRHCQNPETSSRTATSAAARRITRRNGPWFDGYERD